MCNLTSEMCKLKKVLRKTAIQAKIPTKVTSHTFLHSESCHLLQSNYDIRTTHELRGYSDIRTTTVTYTHTVKSATLKEVKSHWIFDLSILG